MHYLNSWSSSVAVAAAVWWEWRMRVVRVAVASVVAVVREGLAMAGGTVGAAAACVAEAALVERARTGRFGNSSLYHSRYYSNHRRLRICLECTRLCP